MKTLDEKIEEILNTYLSQGNRKVYEEIQTIKNGINKYQTIVYFPFLTKSSFTDYSYEDNLKQRAIDIIKSSLKSKYNALQLRDYNNKKRFKMFKKIVERGLEEDQYQLEYSNGLNHKSENEKINNKTILYIWNKLSEFKRIKKQSEIDKDFIFELSKEKFDDILLSETCSYCGLSISDVYDLAKNQLLFTKRKRGYCLEVDQIDPYGGYNNKNCVPCCYWCNNAKTDEFKITEFKEIAKGINATWNSRLKSREIKFPEKWDFNCN